MAPTSKESGGGGRRKSINLFSRGTLASLTQINTDVANADGEDKKDKKKLSKRSSVFGLVPTTNAGLIHGESMKSPVGSERANSPKMRPRTLQKGRPSSLFGSLGKRSMGSYPENGEGSDNLVSTTPESPMDDSAHLFAPGGVLHGKTVLHHGEVQTQSGMFRKKKEYLVLTDSFLIRFKSQSRAAEAFPSIPAGQGRSTSTRHPSTTSIGSLHEVQSSNSHASAEGDNKIPLGQIVTAYKVEDGRPFFTTEVVYLDEEYHGVGSIQLMLHDPKEADLWHTSIRGAAQKARLLMEEPYPQRVIRYLVQALEAVDDYSSSRFQVFRVVKRAASQKGGKSSSDDLQKLNSSVFYMVIGINRIHLVPLPDFSEPSGRPLSSKASRNVFGIVTLVSISLQYTDDRFDLSFRLPLQTPKTLELAASATPDIAVVIFKCIQFLKPQWLDYDFLFGGPKRLLESVEANILMDEEDYGCFDRTLTAFCMGYGCNPMNIQYMVEWEVEDAPQFKLCLPASTAKYSSLELLAIFRALRYNESFQSISFTGIDMHSLHTLPDGFGVEQIAWTSRSGLSIIKYFGIKPQERSVLYQEVQALALKSNRLRKLNFANCLPKRRPRDNFDTEGSELEKDPGCEIVAALLPLCRGQLTNVDWIVLNGIELGETDLDDLIPALDEVQSRFRAIECERCGLNDRGIMQLLSHMERQGATLETINMADNPGKIHVERFQVSMSRFSKLRKLDLTRVPKSSGDEPLFKPEVLLSWQLEELILSGVHINERTLDSICTYLASPMSDSLRVLWMDQCALNGSHVAFVMKSMIRTPGEPRELHLSVSANRLEKGVRDIVQAIEENQTPALLSIRMIEFTKEDHFKQLLEALRTNTTIRSLDISKASLPYDAGPETCDALRLLFEENTTLEELDISGEQSHLEVTRFGIGLNYALTGLKNNDTLKSLRIEYQNLGLEGANTLSSVLEQNSGLNHIFCEHNDISLQGFTILVNALAKNYKVLTLPFMRDDQDQSMRRMNNSMRDSRRVANNQKEHNAKSSVRKTLTTFGVSKPTPASRLDLTPQDLDDVVRVLAEKWQTEVQRLSMFLERNRNIADGLDDYDEDGKSSVPDNALRPTTAMSDRGILEQILSNTTPKVELGNPVDDHFINKTTGLGISEIATSSDAGQGATTPVNDRRIDDDSTPRAARTRNYLGSLDLGHSGSVSMGHATPNGKNNLPDLPAINRERVFDLEGDVFEMES